MKKAIVLLIALATWAYPLHVASAELIHDNQPTQFVKTLEEVKEPKVEVAPAPVPNPAPKPAPKKLPPKPRYSAEANGDIQVRMKAKVIAKWGEDEWPGMHFILDHESGSDPYAKNPKSTACGIPQATPCSKMLAVIGSLDNVEGQLDWMVNYIAARYKTPTNAMNFWLSQKAKTGHGWY